MSISRRQFLESAALGGLAATAAAADKALPRRPLGKTGERVTILAMGCGSRFLMYKQEDKALEALNKAIDLGIRYLDTAYSYGNGLSEQRVGKLMKSRRKEVFLATKVNKRNGDEAMRIIEGSLKRLQTDHVDLLHIHGLTDAADLAAIEANDGVLKVLYKCRDQKLARFVGITSHTDPAVLKTALERHDFNCTQMALNAALAGMTSGQGPMKKNPMPRDSFQALALPVANRKKMGVIAMKVFAQEQILEDAPVEKLLSYSLSLPVSACVAGMPKLEYIEQNIQIARAFQPLPKSEMRDLSERLSGAKKTQIDRFFADHVDA